jgi:hypothetical protein
MAPTSRDVTVYPFKNVTIYINFPTGMNRYLYTYLTVLKTNITISIQKKQNTPYTYVVNALTYSKRGLISLKVQFAGDKVKACTSKNYNRSMTATLRLTLLLPVVWQNYHFSLKFVCKLCIHISINFGNIKKYDLSELSAKLYIFFCVLNF